MAQTLTIPKPGDTLASGAIVVHYTHLHDGGNGYLPHGLALAIWPGRVRDPYVVWIIARPEGGDHNTPWECNAGNYCQTLAEALYNYHRRGGSGEPF